METTPIITQRNTLASELADIQITQAELEKREKEIRSELLRIMQTQGVKQIRLDNGSVFVRSQRVTLKIREEGAATRWATEHNAMKVDTAKALRILRRELRLPRFFTRQVSEYLTVKSQKKGNNFDD